VDAADWLELSAPPRPRAGKVGALNSAAVLNQVEPLSAAEPAELAGLPDPLDRIDTVEQTIARRFRQTIRNVLDSLATLDPDFAAALLERHLEGPWAFLPPGFSGRLRRWLQERVRQGLSLAE